jgi:uncharacterized membrane protein YozB (DUF420 family)
MIDIFQIWSTGRAPVIIDVIALGVWLVLPVQLVSILMVRRGKLKVHRLLQIAISVFLCAWLIAFEISLQLIDGGGWRKFAEPSPYYESLVLPLLMLHLIFAIPSFLLWFATLYGAIKKIKLSQKATEYSMIHKKTGRIALVLFGASAVTGWLFYIFAFLV